MGNAAKRILDGQFDMVRRALAVGVAIAVGSDTGSRHGIGRNALELELLREAGMTPLEAISAATKTCSKACRSEERVGTIAPDKIADFVPLARDRIQGIRGLLDPSAIESVFKASTTL